MRSFSLLESSSDDVRSIGAFLPPVPLILRGGSTSILTTGVLSSLLPSPSSIRTLTRVACTRASKAGKVDGEVLGVDPDPMGVTLMACPHLIVSGARSLRTCRLLSTNSLLTFWLSSLTSLSTFRVLWVGSLRTSRLSSIPRYSVIWGSTAFSPLASVMSARYWTLKSVMNSALIRGGLGRLASLWTIGEVFASPGRLNPPGYRLCAARYRLRALTPLQRVDRFSGL